MKPLDFPLLADQNVQLAVVVALRERGRDVRTVDEEELATATDARILEHATLGGRVVLTHDSDFGALAIARRMPFVGLIRLRPGHIEVGFVLQMLDALDVSGIEVMPPFIVVVERRAGRVRVRVRHVDGESP